MDKWISDDSVFISSSLESSDGVAQIYKLVSADIPLEEDSFSFIGQTVDPSNIAPFVQWQRKDYVRLLHFLHANSLMVNASGHVILKSAAKSRIVGRHDGPKTYWRCLDLLPMQAFGLQKPHDMGIKPNFLIIGGDVDEQSSTTGNAEFKSLKLELEEVKVNLIVCEDKNKELATKLVKLESANEQLEKMLNARKAERQNPMEEYKLLKNMLDASEAVRHKLIEENVQLQIRMDETEVGRKKS